MQPTKSIHSAMIERTASSLITSLSLLIPESGFKAELSHTSYFTRYNMQGTTLMKARKESLGAMLCDYARKYKEPHPVDADWFLIENVADAASNRLFPHSEIVPVDHDLALEGLRTIDTAHEGVQMFNEIRRIATGNLSDWPLSCVALRPFFH
jgi:hypothetical protein